MAMTATKVEVWAGEMPDQPGEAARILDALAAAGANFECIIGRRHSTKPGMGEIFVTPVKGRKVQNAATGAGLAAAPHIATIRIEGPDKPGTGACLTRAIANAGVNTRGLSAVVLGNKFVAYLGFDTPDDANKAIRAIKSSAPAAKPKARKTAKKR